MAKNVDYLTCVVPPSGAQRRSFQRPSSSRPRTASLHYPILLVLAVGLHAQTAPAGRALFEAQCANCHGGDGLGGALGPAIVNRMQARGDEQIAAVIRNGIASSGMPAFVFNAQQTSELLAYLRTL